jgi:hypothetical protein
MSKTKKHRKSKITVHKALKVENETVNPYTGVSQLIKPSSLDEYYKHFPNIYRRADTASNLELRGEGMRHKKQLYAVPVPIVGKYKDGSNIYRDHHGLYIIHFQAKTRKMVKKHLKTLRRYVKH